MPDHKNAVVREAVGAGRWFPGRKADLQAMVDGYINAAAPAKLEGRIVSAIAPHAGYIYSGKVAGYTFRAIRDSVEVEGRPDAVVIAGFSHSASFRGIALMDGDAVSTPLGEIGIDSEANGILAGGNDRIFEDYAPHRGEHSAENQIPFVQAVLPESKIVVAIMGDHDGQSVDQFVAALKKLSTKKSILFVASTDLLHDADYANVSETDRKTLAMITGMDVDGLAASWSFEKQVCCGIMPVITAMRLAEAMGCRQGVLLHSRNSGDDFPESRGSWVVGYGAVAFAVK